MRQFPAQLAAHLICGRQLPMEQNRSIDQRIIDGREMLTGIAGIDFGYDLQRWHDHLKITGDGGYSWRRNIKLPKIMKEALASQEWNEAVKRIAEAGD